MKQIDTDALRTRLFQLGQLTKDPGIDRVVAEIVDSMGEVSLLMADALDAAYGKVATLENQLQEADEHVRELQHIVDFNS